MAKVFNENPTNFVNMNTYFNVLNNSVGFTAEQLTKIVENTNYLYNNVEELKSMINYQNQKIFGISSMLDTINGEKI